MPQLDALRNPTPTKEKRSQAYTRHLATGPETAKETTIQPVDTASLSRKYGLERAHEPRQQQGTFQAPLGASAAQYEQMRNRAVRRFVDALDKQGWELVAERRIQVYPGVYPARDLQTGMDLLDRREFIVRAQFRFRNPRPVRVEVPPHLLEPMTFRA